MAINIRKQIGYTIGAQGARDGKTIEQVIASQEKRGGVTERDREWMREGHASYFVEALVGRA